MNIISFDADNVKEVEIKSAEELRFYSDSEAITWLNIDGLHDAALMSEIAAILSIPTYIFVRCNESFFTASGRRIR